MSNQATLLTYAFKTEPQFPLQASPDTGDLLRTKLTIVATNPGPDDAALDGIQITLPEGKTGTDLTPDASTVLDVAAPPHWPRQTGNNVPANVFLFQPDDGYGSVGAGETLTIVITGLQINRKDGTADVPVVEGSGGCQPPDCPTQHLSITKFPNGWGDVMFSIDPLPPVEYGDAVTLHWSGPASATYTIRYSAKGKGVTVPGPLGSHGTWPGQNNPPLALKEDTTFYLQAKTGDYSAEKALPVTVVDKPPPTINFFKAAWSAEGDRLIFTWDTQYADTCSFNGRRVDPSSLDGSFSITPSAASPLMPSYTLRAGPRSALVIRMALQQAEPMTNPNSFSGGLFAASPRGDTIAVAYVDQTSTPHAAVVYVFDPDSNEFRNQRRIVANNDISTAVIAVAPLGSRVTMAGSMFFLSGDQYFNQYLLSGFDIKDSSAPTLNIAPDTKDSYISVAASTQNVVVGVQHLDGATAQARLLVFDQYNLATALKTIPLKRAVATVCVWPDGSRAFVVDPDKDNPAAFAIDVKAGQITKTVTIGANPWGAALSTDTKRLVVVGEDTFTVIDTDSFTILGTIPVPRYGMYVAVSPDGTEAVVLSNQVVDPPPPKPSSNTATVIDLQNPRVTGTFQLDFNPGSVIFTPDNVHVFLARPDTNIFTLRRMPSDAVAPS
jgi:hypothetical protein